VSDFYQGEISKYQVNTGVKWNEECLALGLPFVTDQIAFQTSDTDLQKPVLVSFIFFPSNSLIW
jgi:hypothetical protein